MGAIETQLLEDERVLTLCIQRMASEESMIAAVARLAITDEFQTLIAGIAMVRRENLKLELDRLLAKLMWDVEDEVMRQTRRDVIGGRL
jgi:hypothetical protein